MKSFSDFPLSETQRILSPARLAVPGSPVAGIAQCFTILCRCQRSGYRCRVRFRNSYSFISRAPNFPSRTYNTPAGVGNPSGHSLEWLEPATPATSPDFVGKILNSKAIPIPTRNDKEKLEDNREFFQPSGVVYYSEHCLPKAPPSLRPGIHLGLIAGTPPEFVAE